MMTMREVALNCTIGRGPAGRCAAQTAQARISPRSVVMLIAVMLYFLQQMPDGASRLRVRQVYDVQSANDLVSDACPIGSLCPGRGRRRSACTRSSNTRAPEMPSR